MKIRILLVLIMTAAVLSACGGRDLSNVKTSLYGHWKDEESGKHYYIQDGSLIQVNEETDEQEKFTYKVVDHDEVKNMIIIEQKSDNGSSLQNEIVFASDKRESAEITSDVSSFNIGSEELGAELAEILNDKIREANKDTVFQESWTYVDNKQEP